MRGFRRARDRLSRRIAALDRRGWADLAARLAALCMAGVALAAFWPIWEAPQSGRTGQSNPNFIEDMFDNSGGLLLIRLAAVALAAFLAGAVVQRIWVANFAIKLPGGWELPPLGPEDAHPAKTKIDAGLAAVAPAEVEI